MHNLLMKKTRKFHNSNCSLESRSRGPQYTKINFCFNSRETDLLLK